MTRPYIIWKGSSAFYDMLSDHRTTCYKRLNSTIVLLSSWQVPILVSVSCPWEIRSFVQMFIRWRSIKVLVDWALQVWELMLFNIKLRFSIFRFIYHWLVYSLTIWHHLDGEKLPPSELPVYLSFSVKPFYTFFCNPKFRKYLSTFWTFPISWSER